jgi:hypothetical protein
LSCSDALFDGAPCCRSGGLDLRDQKRVREQAGRLRQAHDPRTFLRSLDGWGAVGSLCRPLRGQGRYGRHYECVVVNVTVRKGAMTEDCCVSCLRAYEWNLTYVNPVRDLDDRARKRGFPCGPM